MSSFKNYKFRPSSLDALMKKSKVQGQISKTAKAVLNEIFIRETYGIEKNPKDEMSLPVLKGILCENDSISLYRRYLQTFNQKNKEIFENDYLVGEPDLIFDDCVVDIKTAYDIFTFFEKGQKEAEEAYKWQVRAYAWLTKKPKAKIAYTMTSHNDFLLMREYKKRSYDKNEDELQAVQEQVEKEFIYEHIDAKDRVKEFDISFDPESDVAKIVAQLEICREYLETMRLSKMSGSFTLRAG